MPGRAAGGVLRSIPSGVRAAPSRTVHRTAHGSFGDQVPSEGAGARNQGFPRIASFGTGHWGRRNCLRAELAATESGHLRVPRRRWATVLRDRRSSRRMPFGDIPAAGLRFGLRVEPTATIAFGTLSREPPGGAEAQQSSGCQRAVPAVIEPSGAVTAGSSEPDKTENNLPSPGSRARGRAANQTYAGRRARP